jgi:acyl-coenzyme A synthetase/AMP-(fatty) acid ligase
LLFNTIGGEKTFAADTNLVGQLEMSDVSARATNEDLDAHQLIQWCRENARADAVPFRVEIVAEIPKNDRGKIARMDIKDRMIAKWS